MEKLIIYIRDNPTNVVLIFETNYDRVDNLPFIITALNETLVYYYILPFFLGRGGN